MYAFARCLPLLSIVLFLSGCGDQTPPKKKAASASANQEMTDVEAQRKLRAMQKKAPRKKLSADSPLADLIEAVGNPSDPGQQIRAAQLLGERGPAAADAVPALSEAARAHYRQVRDAAADALRKIQPDLGVDPVLIAMLDNYAGSDLTAAHEGLTQAGAAAVPALMTALSSPTARVRGNAAIALGKIGPSAKDAVPALAKALADNNDDVRHGAAAGLGGIGPDAAAAVPDLIKAVRAHADTRLAAGEALGKIGAAAVPDLAEALRDMDADIRAQFAAALRAIGEPAIPALTAALSDPNVGVRESAVYALGLMGPAATPAVITALQDKDPLIRSVAATSLGEAPPDTAAATPGSASDCAACKAAIAAAVAAALKRLGGG